MAVDVDTQFLASSDLAKQAAEYYYNDEYRQSLIAKTIFLLNNVAAEHKVPLVTSKILNQRYERFNLAKSLVEGDVYFMQFLQTLNVQQLEDLLLALKPGLELNSSNPNTAAALQHVYYAKPLQTPQLAVEVAYNTFGNYLRDALELEVQRQSLDDDAQAKIKELEAKLQYEQTINRNPGQQLSEDELHETGKPFSKVFKMYLPKLGNDEFQKKFNMIIRKTLNELRIKNTDSHVHKEFKKNELKKRMLFTADRLAFAFEERGQERDAYKIRYVVRGKDYADKCLREYYQRKAKTAQKRNPMGKFVADLAALWPFKAKLAQAGKKVFPQRQIVSLEELHELDFSEEKESQLDALNERLLNVEEAHRQVSHHTHSADLTYAFNEAKKSKLNILPETYGPHISKPFLHF